MLTKLGKDVCLRARTCKLDQTLLECQIVLGTPGQLADSVKIIDIIALFYFILAE